MSGIPATLFVLALLAAWFLGLWYAAKNREAFDARWKRRAKQLWGYQEAYEHLPVAAAASKLGLFRESDDTNWVERAYGEVDGFKISIDCPNPSGEYEREPIARVTVSLQRTGTPMPITVPKAAEKNAKFGEPGPVTWDIASEYDVRK